ncbi:unnamed protein product [Oreochromis niloticus]|nr:unnamed protein product [Mustela putorius furo]
MEDSGGASAAQEPKTAIEKAILNLVGILSTSQSDIRSGTATTSVTATVPQQTPRVSTQIEMQRSFPAMFQRRQSKGKRPFPAPSNVIHAVRNIQLQFCLLPDSTTKTPKNEIRLLQAGLGRRTLSIADNADHEEITVALHEEYPKMKALTGGWLLYKAGGGSGQRNLSLVSQGTQGYTAKTLKMATNNGKNTLYIVPLQEKIDTTPLPHDAAEFSKMPKSQCKTCGVTMPLQLLVCHVENCVQEAACESMTDQAHQNEVQLEPSCPVCGNRYPPDDLVLHASTCGDREVDDLHHTAHEFRDTLLNFAAEMNTDIPANNKEVEQWKKASDPQDAAVLFKRHLLKEKEENPTITAIIDIRQDQTSQSREIIAFYKRPQIDWAGPFRCSLQGDTAVGTGVQRHFFSMAMLKLQHGFNIHSGAANMTLLFEGQENHLVPSTSQILADSDLFVVAGRMIGHSFLNDGPRLHGLSKAIIHMLVHADRDTVTVQLDDVPDLDIRSTICMLDGNKHLTEQQKDDINNLAISWDLPPVSAENRRWLFQQLLHHAVIGRTKRQTKHIRKGLKDTGLLTMLQQRPDTASVVFPQHEDSILTAQAVLSHIVWPGDEGDDEDDDDPPYPLSIQMQTVGFLKTYIETAQPADEVLGRMGNSDWYHEG